MAEREGKFEMIFYFRDGIDFVSAVLEMRQRKVALEIEAGV